MASATRARHGWLCVSMVALLAWAAPAWATFHLMQIEQFIAGVNGDLTAQAIQLRMRAGAQNLVSGKRLRCWDAAGLNPITLCTFSANVPAVVNGSRILIATPAFLAKTSPVTVADATMTATIPASRLAAGRLTFEDSTTIYWSISWGGAAYTGSNTGSTFNDANGNYGPPFAGSAPSTTLQALRWLSASSTMSVQNSTDYGYTAGAATFINNAGASFVLVPPAPTCRLDYNQDGSLNPDDIGDYITDYFTVPALPGPSGYAIVCAANPPPYDVGYKAGYTSDGAGQCGEPNPDNLGDWITDYFLGCPGF